MTSVLSIETICQTLSYIKDLKKYQSMGKAYDYLTLEELYYKVMELKIKGKSLELDLEKNKQILNYLKEQIAKEIDEKAPIVLNHNFPSLTEEKKINYEHIHLNEYDMPKVKVKRRDEKCYKNQKGPMM